uniref:Uncharacterized protein n=1 Tax=Arion vulgaris TaxID=1028688 RepID=A0A0B6ZKI0_9EUPU
MNEVLFAKEENKTYLDIKLDRQLNKLPRHINNLIDEEYTRLNVVKRLGSKT